MDGNFFGGIMAGATSTWKLMQDDEDSKLRRQLQQSQLDQINGDKAAASILSANYGKVGAKPKAKIQAEGQAPMPEQDYEDTLTDKANAVTAQAAPEQGTYGEAWDALPEGSRPAPITTTAVPGTAAYKSAMGIASTPEQTYTLSDARRDSLQQMGSAGAMTEKNMEYMDKMHARTFAAEMGKAYRSGNLNHVIELMDGIEDGLKIEMAQAPGGKISLGYAKTGEDGQKQYPFGPPLEFDTKQQALAYMASSATPEGILKYMEQHENRDLRKQIQESNLIEKRRQGLAITERDTLNREERARQADNRLAARTGTGGSGTSRPSGGNGGKPTDLLGIASKFKAEGMPIDPEQMSMAWKFLPALEARNGGPGDQSGTEAIMTAKAYKDRRDAYVASFVSAGKPAPSEIQIQDAIMPEMVNAMTGGRQRHFMHDVNDPAKGSVKYGEEYNPAPVLVQSIVSPSGARPLPMAIEAARLGKLDSESSQQWDWILKQSISKLPEPQQAAIYQQWGSAGLKANFAPKAKAGTPHAAPGTKPGSNDSTPLEATSGLLTGGQMARLEREEAAGTISEREKRILAGYRASQGKEWYQGLRGKAEAGDFTMVPDAPQVDTRMASGQIR